MFSINVFFIFFKKRYNYTRRKMEECIMGLSSLKQKTKKKSSPKGKKNKKPFSEREAYEVLSKIAKNLVYSTVKKYEDGPLSSIFNEQEMTALAEDKIIEVMRRIRLFNKNNKHKDGVNPIGATAYFKTSFFNHSQKIYEKYAKTDIRAGVQTVSGEEAQAVAAAKNVTMPENDFIIKSEIDSLIDKLKKADTEFNNEVKRRSKISGVKVSPEDLQYASIIIQRILEGYDAKDIKDELGLKTAKYSQKRREAFDLAKSMFEYNINELNEFFDQGEDLRIYRQDVKKRKRSLDDINELSVQSHFFVQSSNKGGSWKNTLCVTLVPYDGDEPVKHKNAKPKTLIIKEVSSDEQEAVFVRQKLMEESRNMDVKKEKKEYLKLIKAA